MSADDSPPRILSMEEYKRAAECLKVLAHPHRLRVVQLLLQERHYVGQLAQACQIEESVMSDHLGLMRKCKVLDWEKVGRNKYYFVIEPHLDHLILWLNKRYAADEPDYPASS